MKQTFLVVLLTVLTFGSTLAQTDTNRNYIEVNGSALIEVEPDVAQLQIVLSASDATTKDLAGAERKMYSVVEKLGLNPKENLTLNNIESIFIKKKNAASTKIFNLKIKDITKLSSLFTSLEGEGISNISIIKYESSRKEELQTKVREQAVKNAFAKAQVLAKAAGVLIGKAIYIADFSNDNYYGGFVNSENTLMRKAADSYSEQEQVSITKLKFTANITSRWEIK